MGFIVFYNAVKALKNGKYPDIKIVRKHDIFDKILSSFRFVKVFICKMGSVYKNK